MGGDVCSFVPTLILSRPTVSQDLDVQVHFAKDMQATWLIVFAVASHSDGNGANSQRAIYQ